MITRQGRVEVLNDPECRLFPWHPRPVLELSESNAVQLHEGPCLVLFVGEFDTTKMNKGVFKKAFHSIWCNWCTYRSNGEGGINLNAHPSDQRRLFFLSCHSSRCSCPRCLPSPAFNALLSPSDAEEEGELEPAKELIQPIAEKLMAKYKAKEEETPLLFFVAGEVR